VLATHNVDSARHAGVIALVQQHFVKAGDFPAEVARALPRSFEKRLSSDYSDFVEIGAEEVERVRADVHAFVDVCREFLAKPQSEEARQPGALQDVREIDAQGLGQGDCASRRMCRRSNQHKPSSVATSTRRPSRCSSLATSAAGNQELTMLLCAGTGPE